MAENPSTPAPPTSDNEDLVVGKLNIPKLQDAKLAGSPYSESCTLIMTEGDSATGFAMSGLNILGEKEYGVVSLKGNPLNVEANPDKVFGNPEIEKIVEALGLEYDKVYQDSDILRYGHVMLMTDQDYGGIHIKGLLINTFYRLWPSLLKRKGFLQTFVTPIIKALHKQTNKPTLFYSISDCEKWLLENNASEYHFSFYKGLAAINFEDATTYFTNLHEHVKEFLWIGDEDGDAIKLAFSSLMAADRKDWLLRDQAGGSLYGSKDGCIRYRDFINNEYRQSALDKVERSISSMVDGFKRSQRKIFFCALENREIQEKPVLVATFSGYVAQQTFYRHGEMSLWGVMIRMAQDFVGCSNINLFQPEGHFGTRFKGRKVHGHARYVSAKLSPISHLLFRKEDKLILKYLSFGDKSIEPERFYPVIPMLLVNGSDAIATGWNSFVPQYSLIDIIGNIILLMEGKKVKRMCPWYKGFKGDIFESSEGTYTTRGVIKKENQNCLLIYELPLKVWTLDYEQKVLDTLYFGQEIESFTHVDKNTVGHFHIYMTKDQMARAEAQWQRLPQMFELTSQLTTKKMNLFDENGKIKKYGTPEEILQDFFHLRLDCYKRRKLALLCELKTAYMLLKSRDRFIKMVSKGAITLYPIKEPDEWFAELKEHKFQTLPSIVKAATCLVLKETEDEEEVAETLPGYDYLLPNKFEAYTSVGIQKLKEEKHEKKKEFNELCNTSPELLWLRDLLDLSLELHAHGGYGDFRTIIEMLNAKLQDVNK